jgi:hypothetical protein
MHATEVIADACADGVRIARRNRVSAGVELSRRCYLVIAVVAPVSPAVEMVDTVGRTVGGGGIDRTRHQTRAGLTHWQALLGVLCDRRILRRRSR